MAQIAFFGKNTLYPLFIIKIYFYKHYLLIRYFAGRLIMKSFVFEIYVYIWPVLRCKFDKA